MTRYSSVRMAFGICCLLTFLFAAAETRAENISIAFDPVAVAIVADADGSIGFEGPDLQHLNPVGAPNLPWQVEDVLLPRMPICHRCASE